MAGISVRRVLLAVLLVTATAAGAAGPGDLDPTFNGGAPVLLDLAKSAPKTTSFQGLAPAPDGGIMVAGATTDDAGNTALLLLRLSAAGSLDPSFASGGVRIVQAGRGDATHRPISYGLAVLPRPGGAGWIVTGGGSMSDGRRTMVAVAFTPNGELDLNYGSGGSTRVPLPGAPGAEILKGEGAVAPDGSVFLAGRLFDTVPKAVLTKLTPAGEPDLNFGTQGTFAGDFSDSSVSKGSGAVAPLLVGNRILLAGGTHDAAGHDALLLARFDAGGTVDGTFGASTGHTAVQAADPTRTVPSSEAFAIARGLNGEIYVTGRADDGDGHAALVVTRFLPSGLVDSSFGSGGTKRLQTADTSTDRNAGSSAQAVAIDPEGRIVLTGYTALGATGGFLESELLVVRLLTGGQVDPTFGAGGVARHRFTTVAGGGTTGSDVVIAADSQTCLVAGVDGTSQFAKGLVSRVLLAPFTPTTTTLPPGSCPTSTPTSALLCRLDVLRADVEGALPSGPLETRLVKPLATSSKRLQASESATGKRRRTALRKARAALIRFRNLLGSRGAVRAIGADVRRQLAGDAKEIAAQASAL